MRSYSVWLPTKPPDLGIVAGHAPDVCVRGRDGRIRTGGLLLPNQIRGVAGRCRGWPDVPFSWGDDSSMVPGVAQKWWPLAPNLAPTALVSPANVRHPERVSEFACQLG